MGIHKLSVDGTEYDLHDARVSSGTDLPTDVPQLNNSINGDIYFQKVGEVQTSGNWSWVIGPNGFCRLWGSFPIGNFGIGAGYTNGGTWGNVSYRDKIWFNATYPVTFKEKPCIYWMISCDAANAFLYNCYNGSLASTTKAPGCGMGRYNGANGNYQNVAIRVLVIGWV